MKCLAILVNYFSAADTLAAVRSLIANASCDRIHVIDNSCSAVEADCLREHLPSRTQLTVCERNLGFAGACNLAFDPDDAELVLLLNPDARLLPGTYLQLTSALDANPDLAAVAPSTWWDNERRWLLPTMLRESARQWFAAALAHRWPDTLGRRAALKWLDWQQAIHAGHVPQYVDYLSGAALLLRRRAVLAAGGLFDSRFFMFYEDADLSRRLRRAGFRLGLVPDAHAVHRWRNKASKEALMAGSARLYARSHYPILSSLAEGFGQPAANPFGVLNRSRPRAGRWGLARLLPEAANSSDALTALLDKRRLLAVSPSPLGLPAAFRPHDEPALDMDASLWDALEPGRHVVLAEQGNRLSWLAFDKIEQP